MEFSVMKVPNQIAEKIIEKARQEKEEKYLFSR